jgi:putative ABC transport system substrate-binding protein
MKRRQFITMIGGAVASWPLAASGQQAAMPVIGWMDTGARAQFADRVAGFMRGLAENGFVDGQNIRVEDRWAEGQYDRLIPPSLLGLADEVIK